MVLYWKSHLWGQGCISVLVSDHPWEGQGDVGDCDDELGIADVVLASAVGHVVDPLVLVLQVDEALVLTGVPVIAAWVGRALTAVNASDNPPIASNLYIFKQK